MIRRISDMPQPLGNLRKYPTSQDDAESRVDSISAAFRGFRLVRIQPSLPKAANRFFKKKHRMTRRNGLAL